MATTSAHTWWRRIGWLVLIWCASVASLAAVAWLVRRLMAAVGMGL